MSVPQPTESVSSYEGFDFRRLWSGRESVTRVETRLIRAALSDADQTRVLEAPTGFGRLSGVLAGRSQEFVGVDLDPSQLGSVQEAVQRGRGRLPELLSIANLFHLPFASATFRTVASIRVFHHIRDPAGFLREIARVLAPGGTLLLSYAPKPTIATLEHDIRGFLRGRPSKLTFDRSDSLECPPDPFPIVVPTRARARRDVEEAGFEIVRELGEGPERLAAWLPVTSYGDASTTFPPAFLFPTRFLVARRLGPAPASLRPLLDSIACPRCHDRLRPPSLDVSWNASCPTCELPFVLRDRILNAAYVPDRAADPRRGD